MQHARHGPYLAHVVAQCYEADIGTTDSYGEIERLLHTVVGALELRLISATVERFEMGITAFAIVTESHVAIHTWPDYEYVHLEVLSCAPISPAKLEEVLTGEQGLGDIEVTNMGGYTRRNTNRPPPGAPEPPPRVKEFRARWGLDG